MKTTVVALATWSAALLVAGCAQDPKTIQPAYVSQIPYENYTCDQLGQEGARVDQALAQASAAQLQARGNDTVGVILIGLPVSSLSGANVAPQIAQLKGEKNAIDVVAIQKKCSPPASAAGTPTG
ncbi:MAG TPA: hypothetical protein VHA70_15550 [Bauldia sp.]|nr:hypothetical protein [Bauldia sp.]